MTESQLDIFAEIAPAEIADYHPGSPWRRASWSVQYHEMVIDPSGFCTVKLMAAWTGQHWVGGFLMVAHQEDKLLYVLEIMPGAVIMQPGVQLPLRKQPITALVRPAAMADAAHALAHAMTGYYDDRFIPVMQALDDYRRREVVRL